ncbi:ABC transporter permease [Aneurinibacillus aneurinilyticus]|uniref:Bacterial ABC transporter protein EcsB n=1 Tax=Aneurinibacillus aneurinilyticus ATCC 12856 TaxID=649747 RepID=U1YGC1_ANEAE|nr:ABC transporter permease [Aneurinibacillus aneurinilyticus]ERI11132.1 bacterial ABC transporter protein EcsB [Aneurinibacillus aneurinilyticus ATCC 12856]MED0709278.1 ABC transporter permease [Aneurinibacillus aneurinilyticus]MED0723551.1 ABC transporter permease [Aneurinibacillus aneurinilyticus]MED0733715.1 ABC transporter permease [Aneurinibacillus aneurinilyticus]MED0741985.1 ABC transporter permease [Aneurinibacillus aneurinilyticus]
MMDVKQLWNQRIGAFLKEAVGYSRYIVNSGTIVFLVFAFIGASYYYSVLLEKLPRTYPVEWLIVLLFSLLLTGGKIRTFLKEADLVFLLPLEGRMGPYFRASIVYTFVFHALYVFLLLLAVWPLYTHRMGESAESFLPLLVYLLVIKLVNVAGRWQEQRLREQSARAAHAGGRWLANVAVLSVLFSQGFVLGNMIATLLFFVVAVFYYRTLSRQYIHWEHLVQIERRMVSRFYSFVNQFVDVPHIENKVHRRAWISMLVDKVAFVQRNMYTYLYGKVFARSDLFSMFVRLTIVGLIVIGLIRDEWGKAIAYFIILSLTGTQLSTLRQYYRYVFWTHIYPVPSTARQDAVVRVVFVAMIVQSVILYIAVLVPFTVGWHLVIAPVIGIGFSYVYSYRLLRRKLQEN